MKELSLNPRAQKERAYQNDLDLLTRLLMILDDDSANLFTSSVDSDFSIDLQS